MDYGLWIMDYGLWIMDYGLWIMDYGFDKIRPWHIKQYRKEETRCRHL